MSENNDSPAAREHYILAQDRVSNWINNSSQFPAYSHSHPAFPSRSHTPSVTPSQSISHADSDYRAPSLHHSHHSRRSRSQSRSRAPAHRNVVYSHAPSAPVSVPVTYQNGQYFIPPPQPGEQYVIIPSRGQQVHVINPPTASAYNYRKAEHDSLLKRLFTRFGLSHSRKLYRRRSH